MNNLSHLRWSIVSVLLAGLLAILPFSDIKAVTEQDLVASGFFNSCSISYGDLYCWGEEPGDGSVESLIPVRVGETGVLAGKTVTQVESGWNGTCVIADGEVYCWGDSYLGDGSSTSSVVPVAVDTSGVLAGKTITDLTIGEWHTCVVADGSVYCWGENYYGQLGTGSTGPDQLVPVAVDTSGVLAGKTISQVAAGPYTTCVITTESLAYCWGHNSSGQIGDGTIINRPAPTAVSTAGLLNGKNITSIDSGYQEFTCATDSDGVGYCWGNNSWNGSLGNGTNTNSLVPVLVNMSGVLAGKSFQKIEVGGYGFACGLTQDSVIACWGANWAGNLGDGTTIDRNAPVLVNMTAFNGKQVVDIGAGMDSTCAMTVDGQVYCWGYNGYGILGNGSKIDSRIPEQVDIVFARNMYEGQLLGVVETISSVPTFRGYSEAGATITVTLSDSSECESVATSDGSWECTLTSPLSGGIYDVSIAGLTVGGRVMGYGPYSVQVLGNSAAPLVTDAGGTPSGNRLAETGMNVIALVSISFVCMILASITSIRRTKSYKLYR